MAGLSVKFFKQKFLSSYYYSVYQNNLARSLSILSFNNRDIIPLPKRDGVLTRKYKIPTITLVAFCSNENRNTPRKLTIPEIMEFPQIIWPSLLKTLKNFILVHFIIRPYLDKEFNLPDFKYSANMAFHVFFYQMNFFIQFNLPKYHYSRLSLH